ncbi:MAG: tetratricopeptide repeat protein [Anaerolineales bacterium]|nr:tetratricopeptide repeat protein [Anaerolineales bacterium]
MSSQNTILATKLYAPQPRSDLVLRARLIDRLEEGLHQGRQLTLVSAPAGYGKTTLLATWIRKSEWEAAWLSLDEGDNDAARFISHLTAALQTLRPEIEDANLPQSMQTAMIKPVLTSLINSTASDPSPVLLVLDDYHLIQSHPIHEALTFVLEHIPPHMHLVISSRADPPLPIARLRACAQITELRLNDLRFTIEEAKQFLEKILGIELSVTDFTALTSRTEGWAAGLQMAAASLRGQDHISEFIHNFSGSHRYILDYLIEEVLNQQPRPIKDFLLRTSILDQLCAPLCNAILETGQNSQSILEELERTNLFILPLDENRQWYRYHRLFADLLNQRLLQSQSIHYQALHQRAGQWYEENRYPEHAIDHLLKAQDYSHAAALIENNAEATLMQSQTTTLLEWIDALPSEILKARPLLEIYHTWALLWIGAPWKIIQDKVSELEKLPENYAVENAPLKALMAVYRGEITQAREISDRAINPLLEKSPFLYGLTRMIQASVFLSSDEPEAGMQILEELAQTGRRTSNILLTTSVICNLADIRQRKGQLQQAQALYNQALDLARNDKEQYLPVAGKALIGLGDIYREWNQLALAEEKLQQGIDLCDSWSLFSKFEGLVSLVLVYWAQSRHDLLQEAMVTLRDIAVRFDITEVDDYIVDMLEARLQYYQGNLEEVRRWAGKRGFSQDIADMEKTRAKDYPQIRLLKYEWLVLSRLWLAENHPEEAIRLMDHTLEIAAQLDRPFIVIEASMLQALAHYSMGKRAQALNALKRTLQLAAPQNILRTLLDEGQTFQELLVDLRPQLDDPTLAAFADRLLTVFLTNPAEKADSGSKPVVPNAFVDMSERELDVLHLMPSGLSSSEMAEELSVSINTLRTHLKKIYVKLDAHSRYEALARARDLGLLK